MSNIESKAQLIARNATLKITHTADIPVLTARVPATMSREEFGRLAGSAYDLISKLTGHPCMSGRFKFAVEDLFVSDVTRVDLHTGELFGG